jgi:hypothetical protein
MITVQSAKALIEAGYTAEPLANLEASPLGQHFAKQFEHWVTLLPGLRTPRQADGSGGTPPRELQLKHAAIACQRTQNFWSWGMGTGKTCGAILTILGWFGHELFAGLPQTPGLLDKWYRVRGKELTGQFLLSRTRVKPGTIQVVVPGHVASVWLKEFTRMDLGWAVEVIRSEADMLNSRAPIWVYDYDFVKKQSRKGAHMKKTGAGLRFKSEGLATYFWGHPLGKVLAKRFRASLLILDEVHRLRKGSTRTQIMQLVANRAKRKLSLTGTPMDGWVEHTATILGITYQENSLAYPWSNQHFSQRFTQAGFVNLDVATGQEMAEAKRRPVPGVSPNQLPAFLKSTRHLMHRLNLNDPEVKSNVIYPPVIQELLAVQPHPDHLDFYHTLYQEGLVEMKKALNLQSGFQRRTNILSLINQLRLASTVPAALGFAGLTPALTDAIVAKVLEFNAQGRKGLIGTTFIAESRLLHEALQAAGIKGVRIYAQDDAVSQKIMNRARREEALEQFTDDPECRFLIANKELVAEGLNLAETASYALSCSQGYRSNIETQWLARVARPGQQWPHVNLVTFVNRHMVDVYVQQMMQRKIKATASIVDLEFDSEENLSEALLDPVELAKVLVESEMVVT